MKIALPMNYVEDNRNPRRKKRRVNVHRLVSLCTIRAIRDDQFTIKAYDGGSVPNSYRYPALTDGCVCMSRVDPITNTLHTCIWLDELPANKVTLRGVANLFGYADLFDARVTSLVREARAKMLAFQDYLRAIEGNYHYLHIEFEPMELSILQDKSLQWTDRKKIFCDYMNESGKMTDELSVFIKDYL